MSSISMFKKLKQVQKLMTFSRFIDRVHCFSMQVVMNKCLLLNLEKNWRISVLSFLKKM